MDALAAFCAFVPLAVVAVSAFSTYKGIIESKKAEFKRETSVMLFKHKGERYEALNAAINAVFVSIFIGESSEKCLEKIIALETCSSNVALYAPEDVLVEIERISDLLLDGRKGDLSSVSDEFEECCRNMRNALREELKTIITY